MKLSLLALVLATAPAFAGFEPVAAAPAPPAAAGPAPGPLAEPLKDPRARAGYALGLNVGGQMRAAGVAAEVDADALVRGLRDGLSNAKPLLDDAQFRAEMAGLQARMTARRQAAASQAGAENRALGAAFLKANAAKPGVVTLPSGLQYQVLKVGSGPRPKATDTVVCHYRGTLIDGTEFDSSYSRGQPTEFPVGGVIKGWTEALQLMPVGSKWRLVLPAELAYGDKGAGAQIGPGAVLVFEVELLSIKAA